MDFTKLKKVYMIGIKGVGMTMLAQYFNAQGIEISGSDTDEKYMTDEVLKKLNINVVEEFAADNIPLDVPLIIYSTAYSKERNIEVATAKQSGIKTMSFPEVLGKIFNTKFGLAVVGSHGKTTTTAWLGYILDKVNKSPTVMVGSKVPQFDGLSIVGSSNYLIAELDEYQNKLKYYDPKAVILTNIDYDHPDFFSTREEYQEVFVDFIKKIPASGFLIANYDDPLVRNHAQVNCQSKVITYALEEAADYVAYDIKNLGTRQFFKVKMSGNSENDESVEEINLGGFSIQLSGVHNISNALAVIAACVELEVELSNIRLYLEQFAGTTRRMQILGEYEGAIIIDDYAHHPTEIKTTLAGARNIYPKNKMIVVFHPHTFTRTKALLDEFSRSFGEAEELIILDIYGSAREEQGGVHSNDLIEKIKLTNQESKTKQNIHYIPALKQCEKYLREHTKRGDVVILMGAGDVFRIGENLVK